MHLQLVFLSQLKGPGSDLRGRLKAPNLLMPASCRFSHRRWPTSKPGRSGPASKTGTGAGPRRNQDATAAASAAFPTRWTGAGHDCRISDPLCSSTPLVRFFQDLPWTPVESRTGAGPHRDQDATPKAGLALARVKKTRLPPLQVCRSSSRSSPTSQLHPLWFASSGTGPGHASNAACAARLAQLPP